MHNFPSHLICDATLPEKNISNRIGMLFSSRWMNVALHGRCDHDRQISVFRDISSTDWWVCGAPFWLNMRSSTRSHSMRYITQFIACRSLDACFRFHAYTTNGEPSPQNFRTLQMAHNNQFRVIKG